MIISKFINKVINRRYFRKWTYFQCQFKKFNFIDKLTNTLKMDPIRNIPKKFTKMSGNKVIDRQYFYRKTGLEY